MSHIFSRLSLKTLITAALALPCSLALAAVEPITVEGNKVLFGGKHTSIAGVSLYHSDWGGKFYNAEAVKATKNEFGAKIIRAALNVDSGNDQSWGTSYLIKDDVVWNKDGAGQINVDNVYKVIDAAIANDMYVIVDWHTHKAENYKTSAVKFFTEVAKKYGDKPNVIYEIYNEPINQNGMSDDEYWKNVIKPYAETVIPAIRAVDPDNLIIVGTGFYSQHVDIAAKNPITNVSNIAYTLHFYVGDHKQWLRDKATTALNKGIALFVTEWGTVQADGNCVLEKEQDKIDPLCPYADETAKWMTFLKDNKISHTNWALNDKNEGASILKPNTSTQGGWTADKLTASGAIVVNHIKSWDGTPASSSSSSSSSSSVAAEGKTLLTSDGTFTSGKADFDVWFKDDAATFSTANSDFAISIASVTAADYELQLKHAFPVTKGSTYTLCFDAKASAKRSIQVDVQSNDVNKYVSRIGGKFPVDIATEYATYSHTFTADANDLNTTFLFMVGANKDGLQFDNIGIFSGIFTCPKTDRTAAMASSSAAVSSTPASSAPASSSVVTTSSAVASSSAAVSSAPASSSAPAPTTPAPSGGSKGGALDFWMLAGLLGLGAFARRRA